MKKILYLIFAFGIALIVCCFLYFQFVVPYHIGFKEQMLLFVYNSSYIGSYFNKPAMFACLGGDFLTQFFYFKTAGAIVITLLFIAEWGLIFLTLKEFSVRRYALLWSLLPVIIEWTLFQTTSFSASFSVSFIIALFAFILYTGTDGITAVIIGIIVIPVLYVIAGASVFLFLALAILYDIYGNGSRYVYWIIMLALSLSIPFIFRHGNLLTFEQAYFYPFSSIKDALSLVTMVLLVLFFVCFKKLRAQKMRISYFVTTSVVLASILIIGLYKFTDRKQENLLGIVIEAYHNDWDKVLKIAEKAELRNPVATSYINIALSKKSLLGERLMDFYQQFTDGLLLPIAPTSDKFTIFAGNDAYYHIGDMEMAQHAAMLGMIFSTHQRSARMTERLFEINMIKGDLPAANKYKRMLESTLFHKVKQHNYDTSLRGGTTKQSNGYKQNGFKDLPQQGIFLKDIIRSPNDVKASLELLTEGDPNNLPALNYLLCYYLLNKDIPAFFDAYTTYCKGKLSPVPKVYAQALLIHLAGRKSSIEEVTSYGIHPDMIRSFGEYTVLYERSGGKLAPVQEKFPDSYWLFYHFATQKK